MVENIPLSGNTTFSLIYWFIFHWWKCRFTSLTVKDDSAINIGIQVLFGCLFIVLSWSEFSGSAIAAFSYLRSFQTVFHNVCTLYILGCTVEECPFCSKSPALVIISLFIIIPKDNFHCFDCIPLTHFYMSLWIPLFLLYLHIFDRDMSV